MVLKGRARDLGAVIEFKTTLSSASAPVSVPASIAQIHATASTVAYTFRRRPSGHSWSALVAAHTRESGD